MKTSVIDVHDMLSVFSVDEVEKRIRDVPGVGSATVNHAAGNATVRYDETRLEIADIKSGVRQRGYESVAPAAEPAPVPAAVPALAAPADKGHQGHAAPATTIPAGDKKPDKSAPEKR